MKSIAEYDGVTESTNASDTERMDHQTAFGVNSQSVNFTSHEQNEELDLSRIPKHLKDTAHKIRMLSPISSHEKLHKLKEMNRLDVDAIKELDEALIIDSVIFNILPPPELYSDNSGHSRIEEMDSNATFAGSGSNLRSYASMREADPAELAEKYAAYEDQFTPLIVYLLKGKKLLDIDANELLATIILAREGQSQNVDLLEQAERMLLNHCLAKFFIVKGVNAAKRDQLFKLSMYCEFIINYGLLDESNEWVSRLKTQIRNLEQKRAIESQKYKQKHKTNFHDVIIDLSEYLFGSKEQQIDLEFKARRRKIVALIQSLNEEVAKIDERYGKIRRERMVEIRMKGMKDLMKDLDSVDIQKERDEKKALEDRLWRTQKEAAKKAVEYGQNHKRQERLKRSITEAAAFTTHEEYTKKVAEMNEKFVEKYTKDLNASKMVLEQRLVAMKEVCEARLMKEHLERKKAISLAEDQRKELDICRDKLAESERNVALLQKKVSDLESLQEIKLFSEASEFKDVKLPGEEKRSSFCGLSSGKKSKKSKGFFKRKE